MVASPEVAQQVPVVAYAAAPVVLAKKKRSKMPVLVGAIVLAVVVLVGVLTTVAIVLVPRLLGGGWVEVESGVFEVDGNIYYVSPIGEENLGINRISSKPEALPENLSSLRKGHTPTIFKHQNRVYYFDIILGEESGADFSLKWISLDDEDTGEVRLDENDFGFIESVAYDAGYYESSKLLSAAVEPLARDGELLLCKVIIIVYPESDAPTFEIRYYYITIDMKSGKVEQIAKNLTSDAYNADNSGFIILGFYEGFFYAFESQDSDVRFFKVGFDELKEGRRGKELDSIGGTSIKRESNNMKDGSFYYVTTETDADGVLMRYDAKTDKVTVVSNLPSALNSISSIRAGKDSRLFYATFDGDIVSFDANGNEELLFRSSSNDSVFFQLIGVAGDWLFFYEYPRVGGGLSYYRIDYTSGALEPELIARR
jgi:hypothetical protein